MKPLGGLALISLLVSAASTSVSPTSDPIPSWAGAPALSSLEKGCQLEITRGAEWHRLWVNCGKGPHLLSEPSSLTWHVRIGGTEQALELVRLFSSGRALTMVPGPQWMEIERSTGACYGLEPRLFDKVCPVATANEETREEEPYPGRRFLVTRCLLRISDGNLYRVEERVHENGQTDLIPKGIVLQNVDKQVDMCRLE